METVQVPLWGRAPRRTCKLCPAVAFCRGLCRAHHDKMRAANRLHEFPPLGKPSQVVGYVTIDAADAPLVERYRWHRDAHGYAASHDKNRRRIFLQRLLLGLETGDPRQADHINRDITDNRRQNLRIVTAAQNRQNQSAAGRGGYSRYRGVSWDRNNRRWFAQANLNGQHHFLGYFDSEVAAAAAARAFRREHMPFSNEDQQEDSHAIQAA